MIIRIGNKKYRVVEFGKLWISGAVLTGSIVFIGWTWLLAALFG